MAYTELMFLLRQETGVLHWSVDRSARKTFEDGGESHSFSTQYPSQTEKLASVAGIVSFVRRPVQSGFSIAPAQV